MNDACLASFAWSFCNEAKGQESSNLDDAFGSESSGMQGPYSLVMACADHVVSV